MRAPIRIGWAFVLVGLAQWAGPLAAGQIEADARHEVAEDCPPPRVLESAIEPGDTFLQPSTEGDDGGLHYIHVTEADMPWRVAIGRPRRAPRYGSTKQAREVAIEAMQLWEARIQSQVPWFQLEFAEEDPEAAVQVRWKRRIAGPWAGFGGQRWEQSGGCLRVGGKMQISVRPGIGVHDHLTLDNIRELVAHEFGHVLGLGHCHECDSIMNYEVDRRTEITDLDVRTFVKLLAIPNGTVVRLSE